MARFLQRPCLTEAARRTDMWPLWPYLPLTRDHELGYLIDSDEGLWFCLGCLFMTTPGAQLRPVSASEVAEMETQGWRVD